MNPVRSLLPSAPLAPRHLRAFAPIQGGWVWPTAGTLIQRAFEHADVAGLLSTKLRPFGAEIDSVPYGMAMSPFPVEGSPYIFLLFADRSLAVLRSTTEQQHPAFEIHPVALSFARDLRGSLDSPTTPELLERAIADGTALHDAALLWAYTDALGRHWSATPLPWIPREAHWKDVDTLYTWCILHAQALGVSTPFEIHLACPVGPNMWIPPSLGFGRDAQPSDAERHALDQMGLVLAHLPPLPLPRLAGTPRRQGQDQTQPATAGDWGLFVDPAARDSNASAHALVAMRASWPERLAQAESLHATGLCSEPDLPLFPDEDA